MKRVFVLVMGLMFSGLAWSESWVGLNYAQLEQDNRFYRGQSERLETDEAFLRVGADMNNWLGSELRAGLSVESTDEAGFTFEHDYILSGLVRAQYEMGAFSPYVVAGLTRGKESLVRPSGAKTSDSFQGTAVGAGLDLTLGEHFGINAEFTRYYDIGNVVLRGPSAGFFWQF